MTGAFDHYSRRARLQPLLLCAAPAAVVALAVGVDDTWMARIATATVTFGIVAAAMAAARDRGTGLQERLWQDWGGSPTTTLLLSTSESRSPQLRHHREHVRRLLPDLDPLSDDRDRQDPDGSRVTIERYVAHLRERTRDPARFPIVCDANADYGFRRNVLSLRPVGLVVCAVGVMISLAGMAASIIGSLDRHAAFLAVAAALCAGGGIWWWRRDARWVRLQAERYASALLDAAEALASLHASTAADQASAT